jgi:hypothetical protein
MGRAGFGNTSGTSPHFADFALFARCAVVWLRHDAVISSRLEPPMKARWPDWLMAITVLIALGAAALSDPMAWLDPAVLMR